MRYKLGTFEDFKRILTEKQATSLFFSRQVFQDSIPGEKNPEAPDVPPIPQRIITGFLMMSAENANGDVMRFAKILPIFPTDQSEKSFKEIKEKIDATELGIAREIEQFNSPPQMYSGEIEDENKGILNALSQIAAKKE